MTDKDDQVLTLLKKNIRYGRRRREEGEKLKANE
jgi:hypothetical protein